MLKKNLKRRGLKGAREDGKKVDSRKDEDRFRSVNKMLRGGRATRAFRATTASQSEFM